MSRLLVLFVVVVVIVVVVLLVLDSMYSSVSSLMWDSIELFFLNIYFCLRNLLCL